MIMRRSINKLVNDNETQSQVRWLDDNETQSQLL